IRGLPSGYNACCRHVSFYLAVEIRKVPEIKGFHVPYVFFPDINTTVSTVLPDSHKFKTTNSYF
ncbi:MAG: hypothetical protein NC548_59590, partial [Lachnospiraceae bacterium]|nr:hypothetical protein [Lachnospiraceae bacterium]